MRSTPQLRLLLSVLVPIVLLTVFFNYLVRQHNIRHLESPGARLQGPLTHSRYEPGHPTSLLSRVCPEKGRDTHLLILVFSPADNFDQRMRIRMSYGMFRERREVSLAFLLLRPQDESLAEKLEIEQVNHGDLIRGSPIDSFYNLTLKATFMLEWVKDHCNQARFVLKADDDVYLNVPLWLHYTYNLNSHARFMYGSLVRNASVVREYVPVEQYPSSIWPEYLDGPAYLFPVDLAGDLYDGAMQYPYLHCEYLFLTGFVAPTINVGLVHIENMGLRDKYFLCSAMRTMAVPLVDLDSMLTLQKAILVGAPECAQNNN